VLVRRLIGPLVLHDESTRPDFIRADAEVKPGLLDGLVPHSAYNHLDRGIIVNTEVASLAGDTGVVNTEVASPTGSVPFFVAGSVVRPAA
jgi:hypothetical protein